MIKYLFYICLSLAILSGSANAGPVQGDSIEPFSLTGYSGRTYNWKPGRLTVMSLVAFWCDTWKTQNKKLNHCREFLNIPKDDIITVSIDGRWADVSKGKIPGPVLLDMNGALTQRLAINKVPYTLVIDAEGTVKYASQGIIKESMVINVLKKCMQNEIKNEGPVYLTFDDFPNTPTGPNELPQKDPNDKLLDVLKESDVKATFFCICNRLDSRPELVNRLIADGHSIQVHSWNHDRSNPEIKKCESEITQLTGTSPLLYRPPGMEKIVILNTDSKSETTLKLPTVNPYDYTRPGQDEIKRRVLMGTKANSVILLHAGVSETVEVLPDIIKSLKKQGYVFKTLP